MLSEETLTDWNRVVDKSSEVWVFHNLKLSDILAKRKNAVKKSFLIYNNNQPVAICPLYFYSDDWVRYLFRNQRTLEAFYLSGPAIIDSLNEKKRREILYFIGTEIEGLMQEMKVDKCTIYSSPLSRRYLEMNFAFVNPLHEMRRGWRNMLVPYLYLNLSLSEQELLRKMETRTRSILTNPKDENGITMRPTIPSDLEAVWKLYAETHKRTNLPFFPKDDLEFFFNYEHSNFYIAEIKGQPVSVINILSHGNSGYFMSSYTDGDFLATEVATFLLWFACKEVKKKGILHLDLGDQPFAELGSKTDNIARFKRGYGSELRYRFRMQNFRQGPSDKLFHSLHKLIVPPLALLRVKISSKLNKLANKKDR